MVETFVPLISFGQAGLSFGSCLCTGQLIKTSLLSTALLFAQHKLNCVCKALLGGSFLFFLYCLEQKGVNVKGVVIISVMICMYGFWQGGKPPFLTWFWLNFLTAGSSLMSPMINVLFSFLVSFVLKSPCNNVQNPSNNSRFCKPWLEFVPRVFSRVTLSSFYVVCILQHTVWAD